MNDACLYKCGKEKDRKGDTLTLRPSQTIRIVSIGKSSEMGGFNR
jgi:hypothetical protein